MQELLTSFSTVVLKKVLASDPKATRSIAGQMSLEKQCAGRNSNSLLPLAIAHKSSLKSILEKKQKQREQYKRFSSMLERKEAELDLKFNAIIQKQEFLDTNVASEPTVERAAKVIELHWGSEPAWIDSVREGDGISIDDPILEKDFASIWPIVAQDSCESEVRNRSGGLLQDLAERVEAQQIRLRQWQAVREDIQQNERSAWEAARPSKASANLSPRQSRFAISRRDLEREIVFSPRKSPRKSDSLYQKPCSSIVPHSSMSAEDSLRLARSSEIRPLSRPVATVKQGPSPTEEPSEFSPSKVAVDHIDDLEFREGNISSSEIDRMQRFLGIDSPSPRISPSASIEDFHREVSLLPSTLHNEKSIRDKADATGSSNLAMKGKEGRAMKLTLPSEFNHAEYQRPMTGLEERARQSMMNTKQSPFVKSSRVQTITATHALSPKSLDDPSQKHGADSLIERTKQTMSRMSPALKTPIRPIETHQTPDSRRSENIDKMDPSYGVSILTPLDDSFDPTAGHESVFRSRPKIAISPMVSPTPNSRTTSGLS